MSSQSGISFSDSEHRQALEERTRTAPRRTASGAAGITRGLPCKVRRARHGELAKLLGEPNARVSFEYRDIRFARLVPLAGDDPLVVTPEVVEDIVECHAGCPLRDNACAHLPRRLQGT